MKQVAAGPCELCGSEQRRPFLIGVRGERLVQCVGCGFVFLQLRMLEDEQADHEVDDLWVREEPWRRRDDRDRLNEIVARVAPPKAILDVGSYCGFFLDEAVKLGYQSSGIELAPAPAAYAREHFGLRVWTGTLESYPTDQGIDVVTMFHVLEHMERPAAAIRKINNLQPEGGLLVVEVPNIDSPLFRLMRGRHRHVGIGHASYFDYRSLRRILTDNGYSVESIRSVSRTMSLSWLLQRAAVSLPSIGEPIASGIRNFPYNVGSVRLNVGDIIRAHAWKC